MPCASAPDNDTAALLQGTLDRLILKTLTRSEMRGYEIAESIHANSKQALSVEEGALYPALHRLESLVACNNESIHCRRGL
jgi:DNA-binding PadR family transcriptional regulator